VALKQWKEQQTLLYAQQVKALVNVTLNGKELSQAQV
jgi:hypothetical protein